MFSNAEVISIQAWELGPNDAHGNPTEDFGLPFDVIGAYDPGGSVETFGPGRDAVITSPRVFLPYGTPVTSRDRLTVRGLLFTAQGDPADWHNPHSGSNPGVIVALERVTG